MKTIIKIIIVLVATLIGWYIGDMILASSTEIRYDDIMSARVGCPIVGGIIGYTVSIFI